MICCYCDAGAAFSISRPSYHVTEFFEGHERDHILCRNKLRVASGLRRALERIADSSVPDQPAESAGDETVWIMRHVSELRRIAKEVLQEDKP